MNNNLLFAIQSLPMKYKNVVNLIEIEELHIKDISALIKIKINFLENETKYHLINGKLMFDEYLTERN